MSPNTRDLVSQGGHHRVRATISQLIQDKDQDDEPIQKRMVDRQEILYHGHYYDVTDWMGRHPGGGIIQFYAKSRDDATLAIQQFHARSMPKVNGIMKQFKRRPAAPSSELVESMDPKVLKRREMLSHDFVQLYRELESEGFFEPSYLHIAYRVTELLTLFLVAGYLLLDVGSGRTLPGTIVGIILFAMFGARSGYLGHEGGHRSLTGNRDTDSLLQTLSFGLGIGLSGSCWNSQHNRHHDMPQHIHRDHDLRTLPLLAFNEKILDGSERGKNFFVKHQAALSLTVDTMVVLLVWKFWNHPRYAWRKEKYLELLCVSIHLLYVSLFIGFWPYFLSLYIGSIYLFGNYVLSHSHLPVTEDSLHWVEFALCETQDIDDSWWCDWWMGYLNCQIEHHLFPTMPQFRNRLAKDRVKALAAKHNLPYLCSSYIDIVMDCMKNLQRVADALKES